MKTMIEWHESKKCLSEFLQVGDEVSESIKDYFLEVLPPITWKSKAIQMGEPYSCNSDGNTYATIENINGKWIYTGIKNRIRE